MKKMQLQLQIAQEIKFDLYEDDSKELFVNGEELWRWLEVKTDYTKWIKRRIESYGFELNSDYTLVKVDFRVNGNNGGGSVTKHVYWLKPDMVKQLAMVENAEKGKIVRKFYLDMEQYILKTNQLEAFNIFRKMEAREHHIDHTKVDTEMKARRMDRFISALVNMENNTGLLLLKEELLKYDKPKVCEDYAKIRVDVYSTVERLIGKGKTMTDGLRAVAMLYGYSLEEVDKYKRDEEIKQHTREYLEDLSKPVFGEGGINDWKESYSFLF